MASDTINTLNIVIKQDTRRNVECWHFISSKVFVDKTDKFLSAHNAVFDMFLCPQPLLILPDSGLHNRETSKVSENAKLIQPKYFNPPYMEFMLNRHLLDLIPGKTMTSKIAELSYFKSKKEVLMQWVEPLIKQGLYIVIAI